MSCPHGQESRLYCYACNYEVYRKREDDHASLRTALQAAQEEIEKLQKELGDWKLYASRRGFPYDAKDTALTELSAERQRRAEAHKHEEHALHDLEVEKAAHEATKREADVWRRMNLRAATERDEARRERDAKAADAETYRLGLIDWRFRAERAEAALSDANARAEAAEKRTVGMQAIYDGLNENLRKLVSGAPFLPAVEIAQLQAERDALKVQLAAVQRLLCSECAAVIEHRRALAPSEGENNG